MSRPIPPRRKVPPPPSPSDDEISTTPYPHITEFDQHNGNVPVVTRTRTPSYRKLSPGPQYDPLVKKQGPGDERPKNPHRPPPKPPAWTHPRDDNLARLLARRPPPPPLKTSSRSTVGSPRPSAQLFKPGYDEDSSNIHDDPRSCIECRDFSLVDAHAAYFPRDTVTSLDNLAFDLTEPFSNEIDKARAIFTWLHHNIAYDAVSFLSGNVRAATAELTLSSGLAVCDGYAELFKNLAEKIGIRVHKVTGHGKGVGYVATEPGSPVPNYSSNHAWNCVLMDGKWHLIDTCWGAGALDGTEYQQRFTSMWFTSAPAEFGKCHFPEDPVFQLLSDQRGGPISWEDYIMEPATPIIFTDFYKLNLLPSVIQPPTRTILGGQRTRFHFFKRCEHMSTAEADNFTFIISVAEERVPLQLNAEGGWSAEVFIPQQSSEVTLYYVTTIGGTDAKGIGIKALKNALGRQAMTFGGLARWYIV